VRSFINFKTNIKLASDSAVYSGALVHYKFTTYTYTVHILRLPE